MVEADMREFSLGRRFDAVVCLFSSVGYMPSTDDLDRAVATMANHLAPRGVLVVDGWVRPDQWHSDVATHVEDASTSNLRVTRSILTRRVGNATYLEMHHLVTTKDAVDYLVDTHELRLFEHSEYVAAFAKSGLVADTVPSPMPGRDRYVAVSAS